MVDSLNGWLAELTGCTAITTDVLRNDWVMSKWRGRWPNFGVCSDHVPEVRVHHIRPFP